MRPNSSSPFRVKCPCARVPVSLRPNSNRRTLTAPPRRRLWCESTRTERVPQREFHTCLKEEKKKKANILEPDRLDGTSNVSLPYRRRGFYYIAATAAVVTILLLCLDVPLSAPCDRDSTENLANRVTVLSFVITTTLDGFFFFFIIIIIHTHILTYAYIHITGFVQKFEFFIFFFFFESRFLYANPNQRTPMNFSVST